MIDSDYHFGGAVTRSKPAAVEVGASREQPDRPASIDPAVAALLDHIAEDLAREYVRLVEHAAQEDDVDVPTSSVRAGEARRSARRCSRPSAGSRPCERSWMECGALALLEPPPGQDGPDRGSNSLRWWRRGESNPRPKAIHREPLHAYPVYWCRPLGSHGQDPQAPSGEVFVRRLTGVSGSLARNASPCPPLRARSGRTWRH